MSIGASVAGESPPTQDPRLHLFPTVRALRNRETPPGALTLFAATITLAAPARADEFGVSFWLTGNFGSFAAMPADPGLSLSALYFAEQSRANIDAPFTRGGRIVAGLAERQDLLYLSPTYTFEPRIANARASLGVSAAFGRVSVVTGGVITLPDGSTRSTGARDASFGVSDLYPTASLAWKVGSHNFMAYTMAGVPVGTYDPQRLATFGLNYWSIDAGSGYTFFDGHHEISAVLGFTYNFVNRATDYQSGVSAHLDWAMSEVFQERLHIGLVGYGYQQLTDDTGAGATLGAFRSRVFGVGPQIGCATEVFGREWYANVKSFFDFAAENRTQGYSAWLTLDVPLIETSRRREPAVHGASPR